MDPFSSSPRGGRRSSGVIQQVIGWLAFTIALMSAIPLGANRPASWVLAAMALLVLLAAQILVDVVGRRPLGVALVVWPAGLLMGAALVWGAVQTSPGAAQLLAQLAAIEAVHPAWLAVEAPGTISADPIDGRHTALRLCAYLAMFYVVLRLAENPNAAVRMVELAGLFIAVIAGVALVFAGMDANPITGGGGTVTGTFVNRNTLATYCAFGIVINLAIIVSRQTFQVGETGKRALRTLLERFLSGGFIPVLALFVCATGLLATQSRGGAIAAAVGVAAVFLGMRANGQRRGGPIVWLVVVAGAAILLTSASGVVSRLVATEQEGRAIVYPILVEAIGDRPWLGHGLGAFHDAFRVYLPLEAAFGEWDKGHNTYLEVFFELGVPAAIAFFAGLLVLVAVVISGVRQRQRSIEVPLAGLGVITVAAVHSAFDFSLQIPAVAFAFAALLACAVAQSFSSKG